MGTWIVSCENSPLFIALDMCSTQLVTSAGTRLSPKQVTHWSPAWRWMDQAVFGAGWGRASFRGG